MSRPGQEELSLIPSNSGIDTTIEQPTEDLRKHKTRTYSNQPGPNEKCKKILKRNLRRYYRGHADSEAGLVAFYDIRPGRPIVPIFFEFSRPRNIPHGFSRRVIYFRVLSSKKRYCRLLHFSLSLEFVRDSCGDYNCDATAIRHDRRATSLRRMRVAQSQTRRTRM